MEFKEWNAQEIKEFAYETLKTFTDEHKLNQRWYNYLQNILDWYIDFSATIPSLDESGPKLVAVLSCAEMTMELCSSISQQTFSAVAEFSRYLLRKLEEAIPENLQ